MNPKKLFIVAIDDSPTICQILKTIITREGHEVRTFEDPAAAIREIFVDHTVPMPDVLFVDLIMPKITGYQVIIRFRQDPVGKDIPIVAISRLNGVMDRLKTRLAGTPYHVGKPFKTQEIVALIQGFASAQPKQ